MGTSEYYSLSSRFIAVYRNLNRKIPTVSQYERTRQFDHRNSSTPLEVRRGVSHLLAFAWHCPSSHSIWTPSLIVRLLFARFSMSIWWLDWHLQVSRRVWKGSKSSNGFRESVLILNNV